jgi:hypothetical protein
MLCDLKRIKLLNTYHFVGEKVQFMQHVLKNAVNVLFVQIYKIHFLGIQPYIHPAYGSQAIKGRITKYIFMFQLMFALPVHSRLPLNRG